MLGDVREELHVQTSREFGRQLVAQSHEPGSHVRVDLLHPLVEALDLEHVEIGPGKSQRRHGYFLSIRRFRWEACDASQFCPSKNSRLNLETSTPSRHRALTSILSGSERGM